MSQCLNPCLWPNAALFNPFAASGGVVFGGYNGQFARDTFTTPSGTGSEAELLRDHLLDSGGTWSIFGGATWEVTGNAAEVTDSIPPAPTTYVTTNVGFVPVSVSAEISVDITQSVSSGIIGWGSSGGRNQWLLRIVGQVDTGTAILQLVQVVNGLYSVVDSVVWTFTVDLSTMTLAWDGTTLVGTLVDISSHELSVSYSPGSLTGTLCGLSETNAIGVDNCAAYSMFDVRSF